MKWRAHLFTKYVSLIAALVCSALVTSAAINLYFFTSETRSQLAELQGEKARSAATLIAMYMTDIDRQIAWTTLPTGPAPDTLRQRRLEFIKLLRQVPAITEVAWVDSTGREQVRVSRIALDSIGSGRDHSADLAFQHVGTSTPYYGPVSFMKGTEPYLTLSRRADDGGVVIAYVNLKFVWDAVTRVKVGDQGIAYVLSGDGKLIAHPDLSLVLQNTDLSALLRVALEGKTEGESHELTSGSSIAGHPTLWAYAPIPMLDWHVFVELPLREAMAGTHNSVARSGFVLLMGVALSVLLGLYFAERLVRPVRALEEGARRIGDGDLTQRIEVRSGDEIEALADQFNVMSERLQESYATLEQKVAERTVALNEQRRVAEAANQAKMRFLAAASHDLRQPTTTIALLAQLLRERVRDPEVKTLAEQLDTGTRALESLLSGLMDVSRLDARVERPSLQTVSLQALFESLQVHAQPAADAKGLRLRFRRSSLNVVSDPVLLGRELRNLVDNAIRYTQAGGVLIGARPQGRTQVRIEVWDSGIGIPAEHKERIFEEFYQVENHARDRRLGTGLGLAIVQRTARLLGHDVRLRSTPGKGSCFSVVLPRSEEETGSTPSASLEQAPLLGWEVWLVEDDEALRSALALQLKSWGAEIRDWADAESLLADLHPAATPDALITDFRLPGMNGIALVTEIMRRLSPSNAALFRAVLISGDTTRMEVGSISRSGLFVLPKPFTAQDLLTQLRQAVADSPTSMTCNVDVAELP